MIPYNTTETKLLMPEYGRNIQRLIKYCIGLENREERLACAKGIVEVMAALHPGNNQDKSNRQIFWDHLNILSGFRLDIDFPYSVITQEELKPEPNKIPYSGTLHRYRHYGKNIQEMIRRVADMENCIEKDQIIFLLGNQMKKQLVDQMPENVSDAKVFSDIADISEGKIQIDTASYRLNEYIGVSNPSTGKGKKKKK